MAKLTRIGVGGLKSIKNLQALELRPVNILIGSNGAGKSNLISFLDLLRAMAHGTLQDYVGRAGGAETLLHYGAKETVEMWAAIDFRGKTGDGRYFFRLAVTATDSLVFTQEQVSYARVWGSERRTQAIGIGPQGKSADGGREPVPGDPGSARGDSDFSFSRHVANGARPKARVR
jgi:predicted ATPase